VRRLTKKSTYISHIDLNKKYDMILKYDCHGCSHIFLHSFVKDKVACDECLENRRLRKYVSLKDENDPSCDDDVHS
jgi:hypothetical protein